MLLHQFFEHSADLYPGHTAIEDSNDTLTYAEVERLANQVAHYLIDLGAVPESTVAIMLPRSAFVYIAMIGILKTGAAYIPIDPETPGERTDFILEHSEALLLISSDAVFNRIGTVLKNRKVWNIDQERSRIESYPTIRFSQNKATLSNLCYIIYTSGSTGKPKGVLLEHGNVVTYLNSALQIYPITHKDRALQGFSVSFDASVEEIWVPFAVGATIVVGTIGLMRSGNQFSGLVNRLNISYLSCAPTLLSMVDEDIPTVKILIFGGEVCPPGLAYKWCSEGRFVFNTYGPTEAAVVATYKEIKPTRPVTLGTAMPQYIVKILNEDLSPVCGHEEGEIYIGGSSIARGYLNLPDLTGQKFIITDKITGNSIRFFKTGDIARYSDDGEIIYIGRTDAQVKVRGYRVELTEIEGLLSQCQGVKAAVVALNPATQQLSSYVVVQPGETINREQISRMLRSGLPFYMIPSTLDEIDMFPMTTGLKIDRSKLPSPRVPLTSYSRKHRILPTTELEKVLIEQLEQHFNFTDLSMDDNFFDDLGGHSLKAALLVSDLRKHPMFASVSVGDLYKFPILIDLACELESRQKNQHPNDDQPRNFYKPPSIKYYCCGLFQGMALVFLMFLFGIEWLGPFFVYSYSDHMGLGIIHSLCIMLAAYFILLPVITAFAILFKWVVIGKFKPGTYKLWGSYYFRFWLVDKVINIPPVLFFTGTPVINLFYRLLGAKIGSNTYINIHNASVFDLLTIGNNVSICSDSHLKGFTIKDGYLHIGAITIGDNCMVGTRCYLSENTEMKTNSSLADLSLLPAGVTIPADENWQGSPAERIGLNPGIESFKVWKLSHSLLYFMAVFLFPLITMIAYVPGMILITRIGDPHGYSLFLRLVVPVACLFVITLGFIIAILKWFILGNMKEGTYPVSSFFYFRKWFFDKLMTLSLQVSGSLYTTLYLQIWFKLLGVSIGKRSEISTVEFISPDLLVAGEECFLADSVSIGALHVRNGTMTLSKTIIGNRSFVGNGAVVSPGTTLGNDVLLGVLSRLKTDNLSAPDGSAWFGSPAVYMPGRDINKDFPITRTYKPTRKLFVMRYFIEFFRVILPATLFILTTAIITNLFMSLPDNWLLKLAMFPLLFGGAIIIGFMILALLKWCFIGQYRPANKPLWCGFVWRNELITGLYENFGVLFFLHMLTGTLFIKFPLRFLGCKIGRKTCIYTTQFTEFDLIKIGDYSVLNDNCTIQTHLFEDRVMKMSHVDIGAQCSVGGMSIVLYDSKMEDGSKLDHLSVLMKGETLSVNSSFIGIPSRPIQIDN